MAGAAPSPSSDRSDVLIIVLDTVRRDRLGVYGHVGTTPNLERWSSDARVFDRARSVASWTLPAHASLFTGRYPIRHGAHSTSYESGEKFHALPPDTPTLASALRAQGYATVGIAANRGFLNKETGISQGFDAWLCEGLRRVRGLPYWRHCLHAASTTTTSSSSSLTTASTSANTNWSFTGVASTRNSSPSR